MDPKITATQ